MKNKKPKIFIIGFNKTAIKKIHYFFKNNGLNSFHLDTNYLVKHFKENFINLPLLAPRKVFNTKVMLLRKSPLKKVDMNSKINWSQGYLNP